MNKGNFSATKQDEIRETVRDIGGIKRRDFNETVVARPNGLRDNAETAILCRGPGHARKKKYVPGIPVAGKRK